MASRITTAPETVLSGRSRLASLTGVQVLATGQYVPEQVVRNQDLARLGFDEEWIIQRTGIRERRQAAPHQATSDLAYEAARDCLDQAGASAADIDLILVATVTPDWATPSVACNLQRRLGARAAALDVNAGCSGFIYALVTGLQFIKTGSYRRVLVVGADIMSRMINPADYKTYPLFGDGAGAVLLGAGGPEQGFLSFTLGAEGDLGELLCVPAGGSREPLTPENIHLDRRFLFMEGRAVFKWAVRVLTDSCNDLLLKAGLTVQDIDLALLHQANARIIDAAAESLGLESDKVLVNLDRFGNTSAGSIPLVMNEAMCHGRLKRGDLLLLSGFGSGLAWGGGVFRW